ncbi:unnamed protein product, partial [marine sediment metagenome]
WIVRWKRGSWVLELLARPDSLEAADDMMISKFFDGSCKTEIIGHIHIESEWPEEVAELLKGEGDDS